MTELWVTAHDGPAWTVLVVRGKIMLDTREALSQALKPVLVRPSPQVVIDLHDTTVCDSSGLQLLVDAHRQALAAGGWLRLARPRSLVRRVLDITNLEQVLSIHETVDDAVADAGPVSDPGVGGRSGQLEQVDAPDD